MGFKTATIFATSEAPAYFSTNPEHSLERAAELIERLGLGPATALELSDYDDAMYPKESLFALGAYEKGFILADQALFAVADKAQHPLMEKALQVYPGGSLLLIILHSGVNLYGYDLYKGQKRVRALMGSADSGVMLDFGPLQPEEIPHFEKSKVVDGERFFEAEIFGMPHQFNMSAYGESLVFEMAKTFLGRNICQISPDDPAPPVVQIFERAAKS